MYRIIHLGENEDWNNWVRNQSLMWRRTVLAWVVDNHNHSVLVIRYEDLKKDTSVSLRRMLDFLQVPYTEQRLQEVITQGFKEFKRKHSEEFDHYTQEQRELVRSVINDTLSVLKARGLSSVCNIEEYLQV